ncbi:hypothetical protein [Kitasatospora sp. MBT63]|uniref:hypothetical protein n=1 Tax=Kitasatospora sp. MBT63 TaxID=1444768 RepID=UPI000539E198|nr:hypothetical protein [Kitasatospora sp. MBT63]
MSSRQPSRKAALYRMYTGDSLSNLKHAASTRLPAPNALRTTSPAQQELEHQVLLHYRGGSVYAAHPFAITYTRVLGDRTEVRLDPAARAFDERVDTAERAIEHLLPYTHPTARPDEGPGGAPGIRLRGIDRVGLHLTHASDPSAHLVLTGPSEVAWSAQLQARTAKLTAAGRVPLWDEPTLTAAERSYPSEPWPWLSAGVLRRIGLFSRVSTAYDTYYGDRHNSLMVVLRHLHPALPAHDQLVRRLTDPAWGMPLVIDENHCDCRLRRPDRPYTHDHTWERTCHVALTHRDGLPGRLLLRFMSSSADIGAEAGSAAEARRELALAGAPRGWLRRTMPAPPPAQRRRPSLAARRASCTGETLADAARALTPDARSAFPIATAEQERLESEVLQTMSALRAFAPRALGVRALHPMSDQITIDLEPALHTAQHWAALLPVGSSGRTPASGIPGLRHEQHPDGVHLIRDAPGSATARVILHGIEPSQWMEAATGLRRGTSLADLTPWTEEEVGLYSAASHPACEHYIGSGLMRMIRAVCGAGASSAITVSSHPGEKPRRCDWRVNLLDGPGHGALLDLLTDSSLALGLELWKRSCTSDHTGCWFKLTDDGGQRLLVFDH